MKLQIVEESEFNKIEGVRQVIVHDYSHKFATIDFGDILGRYGLSWRSTLVDPIVEFSTAQNTLWIGVDRQLAAICPQSGRLRLIMPLTSNILQLLILDTLTVVLSENEVLIFNPNGSIRYSKSLPDIPEEISIIGTDLVINLLSGDSLTINPQTGAFKQSALA